MRVTFAEVETPTAEGESEREREGEGERTPRRARQAAAWKKVADIVRQTYVATPEQSAQKAHSMPMFSIDKSWAPRTKR